MAKPHDGSAQELVLYQINRGVTQPSTIAERTGLTNQQVKDAIFTLRSHGRVTSVSEGKLKPTSRCLLSEVW